MESHSSSADLTSDRSGSRYELLAKIASGGMATVYVGRLRGAVGFWRLVAIKRAHAHLVENPTYKAMLVDEAKLASKLHHPNVVAVLDVEELAGELRLVMDYVEGAALSDLLSKSHDAERRLPARIAVRIALDACAGLHAAHELCDENGKPLGLVHRDISPHNILVGVDGVARVADFGIAKHEGGAVSTTTGALKGKLAYMAPEYVEEGKLDARSDVFALGIVAWEAVANEKLFRGTNEVDTLKRIVAADAPPLSSRAPWVADHLDAVLASALARSPDERFASAQAFGTALETAARRADLIATPAEVGAYVRDVMGAGLEKRREQIREHTAPIRHEPTVRVTRAASPGDEAAAASPAEDRVTMPDAPPPAETSVPDPAATPAREASGITLQRSSSSVDAEPAPPPTRRVVVTAVAAIALAAGASIALALRGGAPPPRPAPAVSASAIATAEPMPSATAAIAPAVSASVTAAPTATATASTAATPTAPRPSTMGPQAAANPAPPPSAPAPIAKPRSPSAATGKPSTGLPSNPY